jgi:hypothetical protein
MSAAYEPLTKYRVQVSLAHHTVASICVNAHLVFHMLDLIECGPKVTGWFASQVHLSDQHSNGIKRTRGAQ